MSDKRQLGKELLLALIAIATTLFCGASYWFGSRYDEGYYSYFNVEPDAIDISFADQVKDALPVVGYVGGAIAVVAVTCGVTYQVAKKMVYSTYPLWQRGVGTFAYVALTTLGIAILINRGLFADSAITGLFLPMGQGVAVGVTITALVVLKQTTPMGALLAMIYRPAKSLARIGIVLLLALETCVTIANFAEIAGAFDARDACANLNNFRAVVLYSKQSLALEGSTVTEEARPMPTWLPKTLNVPSAAASGIGAGAQPGNPFAYVYRGLRILKKTNTKWILITSDWNPKTGRIVQLSDSPDIRFDYLE